MLRIGFIFPSSHYLYDPFRGDPHTHFQILTFLDHELQGEVETLLIDLRGVELKWAMYHIPECDLYLHSVYTLDYNEQVGIVKNLRERYPKAKHIAGGPHPLVFKEETLKVFDSLVLGDGEFELLKAIRDFQANKMQPIYQQATTVDVNAFPFPRRHWLPASANAKTGIMNTKDSKYHNLLGTTVIFSRGCPYKCTFCAMPQSRQLAGKMRYRSPEFIEEEIEYLKKSYGMQAINLLDEIAIPLGRKQAIAHLEAIGRTGITWRGQCRVDGITPEIAKLAAESGCVAMGMGVESVSQEALRYINKSVDISLAAGAIQSLKQAGIEARIYLICGLPGEPPDILDQTWNFITSSQPDLVYASLFTVRPGTDIFDNPQKYGIKKVNTDWDKTMHMIGRYSDEMPELTFEYEKDAPWGPSKNPKQIVEDYLELQVRIKKGGFNTPLPSELKDIEASGSVA